MWENYVTMGVACGWAWLDKVRLSVLGTKVKLCKLDHHVHIYTSCVYLVVLMECTYGDVFYASLETPTTRKVSIHF